MNVRKVLTKDERPMLIANSLGEIDIGFNGIAIFAKKSGMEDRDIIVTFERKRDILGRAREIFVKRRCQRQRSKLVVLQTKESLDR